MTSGQARHWLFTLNNPSDEDIREASTYVRRDVVREQCFLGCQNCEREISYGIWQLECGEQGTVHLQGYLEFVKPIRLSQLRTLLPRAHWDQRRGSREQARDYCRKDDTRLSGPWEFGSFGPAQGKRNDLLNAKLLIDSGFSMREVSDQCFPVFIRHSKGLYEYKRLRLEPRNWKSFVFVLYGPPRSGKSTFVHANAPNAYWLQPPSQGTQVWWDGYDGHEDVVIDEFSGWLPWDLLLRLLDAYQLFVQTKGGQAQFVAKRIWITSNKHPNEWYSSIFNYAALRRRLERLLRCVDFVIDEDEDDQSLVNYSVFDPVLSDNNNSI